MTDLAGNPQTELLRSASRPSFVANTNPPTVINTSPENTETAVPVNSPVEILFSEPIQPDDHWPDNAHDGRQSGCGHADIHRRQPIADPDAGAAVTANANYTLTITGVKDTAGNLMTSTVTNTFTTGPTFDLIASDM